MRILRQARFLAHEVVALFDALMTGQRLHPERTDPGPSALPVAAEVFGRHRAVVLVRLALIGFAIGFAGLFFGPVAVAAITDDSTLLREPWILAAAGLVWAAVNEAPRLTFDSIGMTFDGLAAAMFGLYLFVWG